MYAQNTRSEAKNVLQIHKKTGSNQQVKTSITSNESVWMEKKLSQRLLGIITKKSVKLLDFWTKIFQIHNIAAMSEAKYKKEWCICSGRWLMLKNDWWYEYIMRHQKMKLACGRESNNCGEWTKVPGDFWQKVSFWNDPITRWILSFIINPFSFRQVATTTSMFRTDVRWLQTDSILLGKLRKIP